VRPLYFLTKHFERSLSLIFLAGFALFVASAFTGEGSDLIGGDAAEYFEYARSLMVDGHLPHEHIKYPCGVALIGGLGYAPIMIAAKAFAAMGGPTTPRWEVGRALPAQIAYCLPLLAFSWIAFRANAAMYVRLGFSERVVKPMVLFWITTTNVGFYVLKEPAMSEGATYAVVSLYYWALIRWFHETPAERVSASSKDTPLNVLLQRAAVVGVLLGLAGMIRQQNILHSLALPLLLMRQPSPMSSGSRWKITGTAALASLPLFLLPWFAWYVGEGNLVLYFSTPTRCCCYFTRDITGCSSFTRRTPLQR
jgi:hypothetical protein